MPDKYPFQVSMGENVQMKAFDVVLRVGGFSTKAAADAFADRLVQFMAEEANATYERVQ